MQYPDCCGSWRCRVEVDGPSIFPDARAELPHLGSMHAAPRLLCASGYCRSIFMERSTPPGSISRLSSNRETPTFVMKEGAVRLLAWQRGSNRERPDNPSGWRN